jgi:hypothetical protein
MGGCGSCEGANRIETTLEVGFNCKPLILNVGVSCIEAISKEKVNWTAVCMPPAGCCTDIVGDAERKAGAAGVMVVSGMLNVVVGIRTGSVERILEANAGVSIGDCITSWPAIGTATESSGSIRTSSDSGSGWASSEMTGSEVNAVVSCGIGWP